MGARGKCGLFLHLPLRQGNAARCRKGIGRPPLQGYCKVIAGLQSSCASVSARVQGLPCFKKKVVLFQCSLIQCGLVRASIAFVSPLRPCKHGTCVPTMRLQGLLPPLYPMPPAAAGLLSVFAGRCRALIYLYLYPASMGTHRLLVLVSISNLKIRPPH